MHNNHRAQAKFEIFANKVRELIIEHDVAFFFGDFNMRLFGMVPFLTQGPQATRAQQGSRASGSESGSRAGGSDQRAALQVTLLTRHVEFDQGTYTPEGPEKKNPITILDTVKHDSMGIFGVGRHEGVRRLGYQVHALVGASWPKLHDGKEFRAGYPSEAYTKMGANGPEPECEEVVGAVYDELHEFWHTCRTVPAQTPLGQGEVALMSKLSPEGEEKFKELRDSYQQVGKFWIAEEGPAVPTAGKETWPSLGLIHELLSTWEHSDRFGHFHGKNGHVNLYVKVHPLYRRGDEENSSKLPQKQRSLENTQARKAKEKKSRIYKECFGWPWEIVHRDEGTYWSTVDWADKNGGLFWRRAQAAYIEGGGRQLELEAYERPWVEAYGEEAMQLALENTEEKLQQSLREHPTSSGLSHNTHTILHNTLHYTTQYNTIQHNTLHNTQYNTIHYNYTTLHYTTLHYTTLHYNTLQYNDIQYNTGQY